MQKDTGLAIVGAFACGALSVLLTSLMVALSLLFTEESFFEVAALVVTAHLPVMIIEGIITAFCIGFLKKVVIPLEEVAAAFPAKDTRRPDGVTVNRSG
ncbi:hypothetical protein DSCOOX_28420 [Desulfosarcina ovata subsp. ovata]|uniref:Uncharacterized protein n=1 Tax=Desulfosarcina ovata subsp. ovata TaxID=2752305 RepID=A0A5K8AAK3_9BACT|nr:hypothetical protein DSCOOX_28420 [Desulfosarcina ovata subsp. ovata]